MREYIDAIIEWRASIAIELPDGMSKDDAVDLLNDGNWPDWMSEQIEPMTAEIINWEAS